MEKIDTEIILKSLWFTCSSLFQTFERTAKSKESILNHAWRIFTGKLGELYFVNFLLKNNVITSEFYNEFEKRSLSVYWGKENVDEYDLSVNQKTIDVKTLPERDHKFLIIPEDQFLNQPKDIYVAIKLYHNLNDEEEKTKILNLNCFEIYSLMKHKKKYLNLSIESKCLGFEQRNKIREKGGPYENDKICHEKKCYRISINELKPIDELLVLLSGVYS